MVSGTRPTGERSIEAWWIQTWDTCPNHRFPLLVFSRNRQPDYVMTTPAVITAHRQARQRKGRLGKRIITLYNPEATPHTRTIMLLSDFLEAFDPIKE